MGNNPSRFKGDNLPVGNVSWNDVQDFIKKLNAQTGKNYRLPTESKWEYAARGGSKSGSNYVESVAWYERNSDNKTHAVGTKLPNELGIYDMSGNVFEWCSNWEGSYSSDFQTNPKGPSTGSHCVGRGGSWYDLYVALSCCLSLQLFARLSLLQFGVPLGASLVFPVGRPSFFV
jgi:formylglycine-generating enzyme required for sulfatase activity